MNRPAPIAAPLLFAALSAALSAITMAAPAAPFVTVALSGQPAPGANGVAFRFFHPPAISDNGVVTFFGGINQVVSPNDNYASGIWMGTPGNLGLLALTGQPAPGAGVSFQDIGSP